MFRVHNVSQWLRHLAEPIREAVGLLETLSFKSKPHFRHAAASNFDLFLRFFLQCTLRKIYNKMIIQILSHLIGLRVATLRREN